MKSYPFLFLALISCILLSNCASSYYNITPNIITYTSKTATDDVLFEYKYDVLRKKYKKRESKHDLCLVAVKITNLREKDLVFGKDINLSYDNGNVIKLISKADLFKDIKQPTGVYGLYFLLSFLRLDINTSNQQGFQTSDSYPVGLVIGPGIAIGNMIKSSSSNRRFKKELDEFYMLDKVIKKGETVYGLIGFNAANFDALKLKIE
jgi:hypothetical protein